MHSLAIVLLVSGLGVEFAQAPAESENPMHRFKPFIGTWNYQGTEQLSPSEPIAKVEFTADAGGRGWTKAAAPAILQCMFRSWKSVRELGERVERLEGELGRLNMENADLKTGTPGLPSSRACLRNHGALASAKPHPSPRTSRNGTRRSPDASRGLSTGGRPSERSQFPTRPSRLRARSSARAEVR